MIIALVITLILTLLIAYVMWQWYQQTNQEYQSLQSQTSNIFTPSNAVITDWTGALDLAAHRSATQKYCHNKGYDYRAPLDTGDQGVCLYNQTTCENDSNPHWVPNCTHVTGASDPKAGIDGNGNSCDFQQHPYLEWHTLSNGQGMCMNSSFPPSFITQLCQAKGLGGWYQGSPICDNSGYCQINSNDIPTCYLTEPYCDSMGLDYQSDGGLGDCNLSDWQNTVEGIFGKTVTRTLKRNTEAMIRECGDNFFSANCALSIGTELTTLDQIAINTVDKEFVGYINQMKQSCSGDIFSGIDSFAGCASSLFPGFYLGQQAEKFVDGMLDGALGWIPGVPHGLIEKFTGYVYKYGAVALNAAYHATIDAVVGAFDLAGDAAYYALDAIGLGAAGKYIQGAISNILVYGGKIANVIANVAKQAIQGAIELFTKTIAPEAAEVFHAVCDAVLHPKEFFTNVAKDIASFFTDPGTAIVNAISGLASVGGKILDAAKAVINRLRNIASTVWNALGPVADALNKVADAIENEFKDIGNDIEGAVDAVGDFFSSIF